MRQQATYVEWFRSYDSRMCVVVLSKHALKDLSIYCNFYFFFYLLVKLFTLPELIALVNKDLQSEKMRFLGAILRPFGRGRQKFVRRRATWTDVSLWNFVPIGSGLLQLFPKKTDFVRSQYKLSVYNYYMRGTSHTCANRTTCWSLKSLQMKSSILKAWCLSWRAATA